MKKQEAAWWGTFKLEEQNARFWEIGPMLLGIERLAKEWRLASYSSEDLEKNTIKIAQEDCPDFPKDKLQFRRYVFHHTDPTIILTPTLADRSQVSRAETSFSIPPDEHITIYVSSPVWVRIETGSGILLDEIPSIRQSDTWHGPNTREGELCYSSRTFCRTNIEELPIRQHRVLTPVVIHNHHYTPLLIEQLSLPLSHLSIFADENGGLWTEEIVIKNELHNNHIVKQSKGAPHMAKNAILISKPRFPLKPMNFISLFYSLLTE